MFVDSVKFVEEWLLWDKYENTMWRTFWKKDSWDDPYFNAYDLYDTVRRGVPYLIVEKYLWNNYIYKQKWSIRMINVNYIRTLIARL